jgi:ATP-dependent DNA helicase RecG
MSLDISIEAVRGVGAKRGAVLKEAGIATVEDLLYYLPRRYLDRSRVLAIAQVPVGVEVTLIGQVRQSSFVPGSRPRFVLVVEDDSEDISCVWFQGGRYMQRNFSEGDVLALSGKVEVFQGRRQMVHPEYEFVSAAGDQGLLHTGGIVPLYASSADMKERGLRSRGFRRLVRATLDEFIGGVEDSLADKTRQRLDLVGLAKALEDVHFPQSLEDAQQARRRLAFDELYALQLRLALLRRQRLESADGRVLDGAGAKLMAGLEASLPFTPTAAQRRVTDEILADMARPSRMSRLLQGDVGSGKTLVALFALLQAVDSGFQAVLMAPTEILAEQHAANITAFLGDMPVEVAVLTGRKRSVARRQALEAIASGRAGIAVGTHALIQEGVEFDRLGLAVVDEQHRFGVMQREVLYDKGGPVDVLVMTATPIPRTLALTLYGDLDVSVIDELPPGRLAIRTAKRDSDRRDRIFDFVAEQARLGRQAYVVYPLIEGSEKLDLRSATEGWEELSHGPLHGLEVGLLHGRLKGDEKNEVMRAFKEGAIQVLVSTTVIEVGVDVPNATIMVIEHAERFGLSQLHQLRGRVGRGSEQSYCILVSHARGDSDAGERLEAMCQSQDGFVIAQKDLELRGPGEIFGTRQAGVPQFRCADPIADADLLDLARREAKSVVEAGTGGEV